MNTAAEKQRQKRVAIGMGYIEGWSLNSKEIARSERVLYARRQSFQDDGTGIGEHFVDARGVDGFQRRFGQLQRALLHARAGGFVPRRDRFQMHGRLALLARELATRHERATRDRLGQIRRQPADRVEFRRPWAAWRGCCVGAPCCTGVSARGKRRPRVAVSTMRPAYITCTRSQNPLTTPRSCVMNTTAVPWSRLQLLDEFENLRLHGHVERGGRFVGDEEFGVGDERHGDHHALAHAAAELVRVRAQPVLRRRGCRPRATPTSARLTASAC